MSGLADPSASLLLLSPGTGYEVLTEGLQLEWVGLD
jgi:hypothetical protein